MIKYSVKKFEGAGGGGSDEMLGYNNEKIATLKDEVDSCFTELKARTDLLDDLETIVQDCWNGPDAEKYLDSVFTKANELIRCCGDAYAKITATIDEANSSWTSFQQSNSVTV